MSDTKYPKSYSQRLADFIDENGKEPLMVADVKELIKDFCALEYSKIKEQSDVIPFGKYRGKSVKVLCNFDRQYVEWLIEKKKLDHYPIIKKDIYKYLKALDSD